MHHSKHALKRSDALGNRLPGYALPVLALLMPVQAPAQDLFTGMIVADGESLVLERCHLGKTRYRLTAAPDAEGGDPLARLRGGDRVLQAELIARYRADGEGHGLEVLSVERIVPGQSCHLLDAVGAAFSTGEPAPEPRVRDDRWEALTIGTAAPAGTETIGSGNYAYRFTLRHPRSGQPMPHTDYALSASRATDYALPFVTDEKKVFQGRTDAAGRTPVFRLPVRLPDAAFDLRERFGSGPYGETFHLTDHHGNDLFNTPYGIVACTTPPRVFRGYSYPNGNTAYTASTGPIKIRLTVLDAIDEPLPTSCEDGRAEDGRGGDGDHPPTKPEGTITPAAAGE